MFSPTLDAGRMLPAVVRAVRCCSDTLNLSVLAAESTKCSGNFFLNAGVLVPATRSVWLRYSSLLVRSLRSTRHTMVFLCTEGKLAALHDSSIW